MPKFQLIAELYDLQGDICPLCKHSISEDVALWLKYIDQKRRGKSGRRKGEKKIKRKNVNLNIDHIVAVANGGTDDIDNLALTHRRCNDIRGTIKVYDKRPKRSQPVSKQS